MYVQMRNSSRQQHGILCLLLIVISFGNIKSSSALLVKSFQRALLLSVGRNNCNQPFCIRFSKITNENDINVSSDWTRQELTDFAEHEQGFKLSLSTLGPGFRVLARSTHNATEILGYLEGLCRGKVLQIDKLMVFSNVVDRVRHANPQFTGGGTPLGVGLYLAYLALLQGEEQGCTVAESLAIDDGDEQHRKYVRLYQTAGFELIKYVGDDWKDIPDRIVWGGCGSLLAKDIASLKSFWTKLFEKSKARRQKR